MSAEHHAPHCGICKVLISVQGHDYPPEANVRKELIDTVRRVIGPIATPDTLHWAPGLPKTRSGKIMSKHTASLVLALPDVRHVLAFVTMLIPCDEVTDWCIYQEFLTLSAVALQMRFQACSLKSCCRLLLTVCKNLRPSLLSFLWRGPCWPSVSGIRHTAQLLPRLSVAVEVLQPCTMLTLQLAKTMAAICLPGIPLQSAIRLTVEC